MEKDTNIPTINPVTFSETSRKVMSIIQNRFGLSQNQNKNRLSTADRFRKHIFIRTSDP